jgi:phytoene dehydrogenase-like protein
VSGSLAGQFDAAVIGCGLSGLTLGLHLQRAGRRVLILERRALPGGLCGTHVLDGHEFVTACNDFGLGMERELRTLGVRAKFAKKRTRFHLGDRVIDLPPSRSTLLWMGRHLGDFLGVALALRREADGDLATFVEQSVRSQQAADLVCSLAYPLGRSARDLPLDALRSEFSREYAYGYHQPLVPVGGPRVLIERMVKRFQELGGTLVLGAECLEIGDPDSDRGGSKVLITSGGEFQARRVISSQGRWDEYPADCRPGLAVSTLHVAVRKDLVYPPEFHTLVHVAPRVIDWLDCIDRGEEPSGFGFHLFRSDLPERPDHYTINLYLYLPRGVDHPGQDQIRRAEDYVFEHAERMLPGLRAAVLYKRFVSSGEFSELHGLSSCMVPRVPSRGFRKPDAYDEERDLFHVGNSVLPPGDHAGAAILSARLVSERILRSP